MEDGGGGLKDVLQCRYCQLGGCLSTNHLRCGYCTV